ncbi:MAG TPA: hypothetical protein VGN04_05185, partial [Herbaspirillum sp.]
DGSGPSRRSSACGAICYGFRKIFDAPAVFSASLTAGMEMSDALSDIHAASHASRGNARQMGRVIAGLSPGYRWATAGLALNRRSARESGQGT